MLPPLKRRRSWPIAGGGSITYRVLDGAPGGYALGVAALEIRSMLTVSFSYTAVTDNGSTSLCTEPCKFWELRLVQQGSSSWLLHWMQSGEATALQ
jgi:hypothetical protein